MAEVPRISVVVPIYNVERYLDECLLSLSAQTAGDLEVVMVDDGATDGSAAIAEHHAERDPRLRLVRQSNHGLGHARNTGVQAATGDFLTFVDSDDRLPADALELLLGSLDRTGSDFATGNIHRFTEARTWPAPFLRKTFLRRRPRTHVSRFHWLLSDRMAQNKLWRRSFWDEHGLRFPEGVLHEDIPVVVPGPLPGALGRRASRGRSTSTGCARTASSRSPSGAPSCVRCATGSPRSSRPGATSWATGRTARAAGTTAA